MKTKNSISRKGRRLLYVEGDNDSREMLTLLLERAGYQVSCANSVTEGLSLARPGDFDLYILDSRLEDGTGNELCRQIRASDQLTPIIFYSSLAYPWDIKAGLAAGAQAYLVKPMGIYTIVQTIAELLDKTSAEQGNLQIKLPDRIKKLPIKPSFNGAMAPTLALA